MVDHSELFQIQVQKSNGLYLPAKFLFNSGFVDEQDIGDEICSSEKKPQLIL